MTVTLSAVAHNIGGTCGHDTGGGINEPAIGGRMIGYAL